MTSRKPTRGRPKGRKFTASLTVGMTPDRLKLWKRILRKRGLKQASFYRKAIQAAIQTL